MLTARQEAVLTAVVEGYVEAGQPVGSKWLASRGNLGCGPSTVRNELALLEERGLLSHPHTSAGRVPTDAGYRFFVDHLLESPERLPAHRPAGLSLVRSELDEAMRTTTAALSQMTNLLAIVSAPPIGTTSIRHVEVLALQPQVLMVVIITSTGGVSKRIFTFEQMVDPGLVDWASSYLNEQLVGMGLGARMLAGRLSDTALAPVEQAFLQEIAPAFTDLVELAEHALYVDGAARLLREDRFTDLSQINELMELLERRVTLISLLRSALGQRQVYVRIGNENEAPALRSLAIVAVGFGLPQRNLGAVSVIGPTRMDYAGAIRSVREVAGALSRFVEDVYDD